MLSFFLIVSITLPAERIQVLYNSNYYPLEFHRTLAAGSSWGNAFKSWYNYYGKSDDSWFLGMVILGDPALKIQDMTADRALSRGAFDQIIPPDRETVSRIAGQLTLFDSLDFE